MDQVTAKKAVVSVSGLTKRYAGRDVLAGIDLEIAAGETYALLGPNGAGKSTTIEVLEGIRRPGGGEVSVLGEDPLSASRAWRSRIGIVAQSTGDLGVYTPRELISHFGSLYPNPRGVDEVLDLVGLTDRASVRATKLSGGQQRRLDVALGIVGRPELLFLDEPTTGFDPEARRQFWDMLAGLTGEGTAILLTTHYLDEAAHLADRVGVLTGGTIVAEAPPAQLGGADARVPIVRWRDAGGSLREERTHTPGALIEKLCAEARELGFAKGEPAELEVRRPTLEEIYLELIGANGAGGADELTEATDTNGADQ
ncbi:ABC transporter ATP-binding protein [Leucobacter denitrificans]|uniref:ABC transporter ATP-binding protein n=1 Tax=Leucobacter denitrificans TaxID=683042 RepID=A0A7G9S2Z9_9MICO|nr:ABC transporter ATP-binding protein [Leucobacter denitrificans]QNN62224.1 ABC transporter ATP-binding protein [Leucobacter denitrificans]